MKFHIIIERALIGVILLILVLVAVSHVQADDDTTVYDVRNQWGQDLGSIRCSDNETRCVMRDRYGQNLGTVTKSDYDANTIIIDTEPKKFGSEVQEDKSKYWRP